MLKARAKPPKTVEEVYNLGLCNWCGTCAGMCPQNCIEMVTTKLGDSLFPKLEADKCTQCMLCLDVCPGESVDFEDLNQLIFGRQPEEASIGNTKSVCLVWSKDAALRKKAASGGAVTELASFAIESGLVKGVVVTRVVSGYPLRAEPFIARSRKEIESSCGSLYLPVSMNTILKEIVKEEGHFALIGLPCHIEGARKAAQLNSKLHEKLILHLGIFCVKTPNFHGTEYYLRRKGIDPKTVKSISYRGMGWPGSIRVTLQDKQEFQFTRKLGLKNLFALMHHRAAFGLHYFESSRCRLCVDETNELSDIAFGDPWLPELMTAEEIGKSLCVVRSSAGSELISGAIATGRIATSNIDTKDVIRSQSPSLLLKKSLSPSAWAARHFGYEVPRYPQTTLDNQPKVSFGLYVLDFIDNLETVIGRRQALWRFIGLFVIIRVLMRGVYRKLKKFFI